jgi:TRAP-type uncharacterized transport system substrate-binding protein
VDPISGRKTAVAEKANQSASNTWTWVAVLVGGIATLATGFILLVEAPPPRTIVIATGSQEGAYYRFAQQYAELLKQDGVTLDVRATKGSVENLKLLRDENSEVHVALVQSGIADPAESAELHSLCSLYREPLWIFYRGSEPSSNGEWRRPLLRTPIRLHPEVRFS